ncbi:MAG: clan AA aspartic protease [Saprospiraceae bacterium]|nr:clan AA aspartic protease [Saprospiraceae bacterium]
MFRLICSLILAIHLLPLTGYGQFSASLLQKIRSASEDYYLSRDTLPITGSRTLPCLDVTLNGKGPYRFLIDLGSNVVNFKKSVAEEAGLELVVPRDQGTIAMVRQLTFGGNVFLNVYGAIYDDLDVDGVLGYNLLGKSNFCMDYQTMRFGYVGPLEDRPDDHYLPFEVLGRIPYVKTRIGSKEIYLNFDTGASGWLYFPETWKDSLILSSSLQAGNNLWNNQTGHTRTSYAQLKENIPFGYYHITKPTVVFLPEVEDAFVGSALLSDFQLTFYPDQKVVKMVRAIPDRQILVPTVEKN